jgi:hypothetical protein
MSGQNKISSEKLSKKMATCAQKRNSLIKQNGSHQQHLGMNWLPKTNISISIFTPSPAQVKNQLAGILLCTLRFVGCYIQTNDTTKYRVEDSPCVIRVKHNQILAT